MSKATLEELREQAVEILKEDGDIFCEMINELDSWDGYADGFRCFPMYELDEFFGEMKVSEFLDKLAGGFDHTDEYFVDTIYGIQSTDSMEEVYRDNIDEKYLLDDIIENKNHLWFSDKDFEELIDSIIDYEEEEEEEEEEETEE